MNFSLSAPRRETFLVSAVIAILVVIGMIVRLPFFTSYALGLLLIAYLILAAGDRRPVGERAAAQRTATSGSSMTVAASSSSSER